VAELIPNGFSFVSARVRAGAAGRKGAVFAFVLFVACAALEDSVALLCELAGVIILGGDSLLYLPVMAQGGDSLGFRLRAEGAGIGKRAGERAGGDGGVTFLPVVGTVCGGLAGAVDQVIDGVVVGDGIAGNGGILRDGNILVA